MLNRLKEIIAEKGNAVGTFLAVATVPIIECMGYAGVDFVIIDTEHGPYDTETMSDLIKAADNCGMAPVVRIADVTHKEIQRAVDNGAQALIIPCLREVDDFKKAVDLAKYAPIGNRGFTKGRGAGFGCAPWADCSLPEFMANANEKVLVIPQCETQEALDHIEEIVQIEGLDGIFIGPNDLSICMGIPGEFDNPKFLEAIARILKACKDAGKLCTIYSGSVEDSRKQLADGMDAVATLVDANVIIKAYKDLVGGIRV